MHKSFYLLWSYFHVVNILTTVKDLEFLQAIFNNQ